MQGTQLLVPTLQHVHDLQHVISLQHSYGL